MRKFFVAKGFENRDVILPTRGTKNSAGYDFRILDGYTLKPGETHFFATGVKAAMESDEALFLYPRSSIGIKRGLMLTNTTGIIDSDYFSNPDNDGHIMISLRNMTDHEVTLEAGERVAQGIFMKYLVTDDDTACQERVGGFGSTARK